MTRTAPAMTALIGKYFCGVFEGSMRSGIIEAAVEDELYLVRFDTFIGFKDGSKWPEYLALVPLGAMIDSAEETAPPAWVFFDNPKQREIYQAWVETPVEETLRVVPIRKDDK